MSAHILRTIRFAGASDVISIDEFIETFELAEPGKSFQVYSRNHFRRPK